MEDCVFLVFGTLQNEKVSNRQRLSERLLYAVSVAGVPKLCRNVSIYVTYTYDVIVVKCRLCFVQVFVLIFLSNFMNVLHMFCRTRGNCYCIRYSVSSTR